LTKRIEGLGGEFWQFIEKQHAVMGERDLPRLGFDTACQNSHKMELTSR
jgi:hypothetical protein